MSTLHVAIYAMRKLAVVVASLLLCLLHLSVPAPLVRPPRLDERALANAHQCFTLASAQRIASCRQLSVGEAVHFLRLVARLPLVMLQPMEGHKATMKADVPGSFTTFMYSR